MSSLRERFNDQAFGPEDSTLASFVNHPLTGLTRVGDWLNTQLKTAAGLPEPYDNPTPLIAPDDQQRSAAALNLAGFLQGSAFGVAPKASPGTLGTFIGPRASLWDRLAGERALAALDRGEPPEQVWRRHGVGRLPDGQVFSELDDQGLRLAGNGTVIEHPLLASTYDLSGLKTSVRPGPETQGFFDRRRGELQVQTPIDPQLGLLSPQIARSVADHELQHAVQSLEGWARGGSPQEAWGDPGARAVTLNLYRQRLEGLGNLGLSDIPITLDKAARDLAGEDYYRRLTGEAQARASQARLGLSPAERRDNYPLAGNKLADVPLRELIYRY